MQLAAISRVTSSVGVPCQARQGDKGEQRQQEQQQEQQEQQRGGRPQANNTRRHAVASVNSLAYARRTRRAKRPAGSTHDSRLATRDSAALDLLSTAYRYTARVSHAQVCPARCPCPQLPVRKEAIITTMLNDFEIDKGKRDDLLSLDRCRLLTQ